MPVNGCANCTCFEVDISAAKMIFCYNSNKIFKEPLGFTKSQPFFILFLLGIPCGKKAGKCRLVQFDEEFYADWEGTAMVEIRAWTESFAQKLQGHFGPRLLFVGYQGSYGRGEAPQKATSTL